MNELSYKEEIEALQDEPDYEARGDELYLNHKDDEARLEWAFYRPSGSHPQQVSDRDTAVAIMAFNHSRLGALQRLNLLNSDVIYNEELRHKIRNRSRMLFRAMIDDNFDELVEVLQKYPMFFDLAYDQMINGRIWNETYANSNSASTFLYIADEKINEILVAGVKRRLMPIGTLSIEELKLYLEELIAQVKNLHNIIKAHYVKEFEKWLEQTTLHPLQKIIWQNKINLLKEK